MDAATSNPAAVFNSNGKPHGRKRTNADLDYLEGRPNSGAPATSDFSHHIHRSTRAWRGLGRAVVQHPRKVLDRHRPHPPPASLCAPARRVPLILNPPMRLV